MASSVLIPYLNFLLFGLIVWWFGRKPLNAMAQGKLEDFKSQVERALKSKNDAEEALKKAQAELFEVARELAEIKEQIRVDIHKETKKTLRESEELAKQILAEARRHIDEEISEATKQLERELLSRAKTRAMEQIKGQLEDTARDRFFRKQTDLFAQGK